MVRIFHCADIHLDSPFSLFSPREAEKRRTQLRGAFTSALMFAHEMKADLFIISGDLFDGEYVTRDTRELLVREFAKYKDMRIFISPGNHDPLGASSPYETTEFPENVHVFGKERGVVSLDELGVDVYGVGFASKDMISSPVDGWTIRDKNKINILVCHGEVGVTSSVNGPISKRDIANSGFDYIALGHIHKPSGLLCENGVYYCYPGCIEGRSFDELGYHGAMCGIIEKGKAELGFKCFSKSRYEWKTIDLSGVSDKLAAMEIINNAIREFTDDTALRLTLVGETKGAFVIRPEDIGKGCEYPFYVEIEDKTFLRADMKEIESENTLKGVFYRKILEAMNGLPEDSEEYRVLSLAAKYGIAALEDRNVADY